MIGLLTKVWRDLLKRRLRSLFTILASPWGGRAGSHHVDGRNVVRAQREVTSSTSQADISYWLSRDRRISFRFWRADSRITAPSCGWVYSTKWRSNSSWMDIELVGIEDSSGYVLTSLSSLRDGTRRRARFSWKSPQPRVRRSGQALGGVPRSLGPRTYPVGQRHLAQPQPSVQQHYQRALGYVPTAFVRRSLNTTVATSSSPAAGPSRGPGSGAESDRPVAPLWCAC